jgi:hypothetical protein
MDDKPDYLQIDTGVELTPETYLTRRRALHIVNRYLQDSGVNKLAEGQLELLILALAAAAGNADSLVGCVRYLRESTLNSHVKVHFNCYFDTESEVPNILSQYCIENKLTFAAAYTEHKLPLYAGLHVIKWLKANLKLML